MADARATTAAVVAVIAILCCPARGARAQERDPAAAQALFDQAQALVDAKRYAEACPKLAESQRLDPGIGTQFHLAACYEHEGKLASAWAAFLEVASLSTATGQEARAKASSRRASLLAPRLPRLRVTVPPASRAAGLEITRDDVLVGEAQWELALPLDPGAHRIEVTAPGRRAFATALTATEGATATFEVPVLEAAVVAAAPAAAPAPIASAPNTQPQSSPQAPRASRVPAAPASGPPPPEPAAEASSSGDPSALVIGLGIGGVVLAGAGAVLGLMAKDKYDDSKAHCSAEDENRCSERGVALRDDAFVFGHVSTAAFIAAGVTLATGGVLWLLAGDPEPEAERAAFGVDVSPQGASVAVTGRF